MAMRGKNYLFILLALNAAAVSMADNVLDAKLNALKKKAQPRTYSSQAVLNDQNLVIPKAASAQEKALDEKIRAMEKELDAQPSLLSHRTPSVRPIARPAQESPANWLTPALVDQASSENAASDEADTSWIMAELDRQKLIRQEALTQEEEKKLVDQRVQNELRKKAPSSFVPLKSYDAPLRNIVSRDAGATQLPTGLRSSYNRREAPSTISPAKKVFGNSPSRFSAPKRRESVFQSTRPASAVPTPEERTLFPRRRSSLTSELPRSTEDREPLRKRIRSVSPRYDENPFEEDFMPDSKKSIWD